METGIILSRSKMFVCHCVNFYLTKISKKILFSSKLWTWSLCFTPTPSACMYFITPPRHFFINCILYNKAMFYYFIMSRASVGNGWKRSAALFAFGVFLFRFQWNSMKFSMIKISYWKNSKKLWKFFFFKSPIVLQ